MSNPSPELAWIGAIVGTVGGAIAILVSCINLVIMWRNRRRIEFRVFSANRFAEKWSDLEIERGIGWSGPPGTNPGIPVGGFRRAYIVIEFAIRNEYPTEITVGPIVVDGWMFSDRYRHLVGDIYPVKRDFRVYNLHTKELTSLETFVKVSPKASYGLRIEVLEDTDGPQFISNHSRYIVELPRSYKVNINTDVQGLRRKTIKFPAPLHQNPQYLSCWSEELIPTSEYMKFAPQDWQLPKTRYPLRVRLKNIRYWARNLLVYGGRIHILDQPHRILRILRKIPYKRPPAELTDSDNIGKG